MIDLHPDTKRLLRDVPGKPRDIKTVFSYRSSTTTNKDNASNKRATDSAADPGYTDLRVMGSRGRRQGRQSSSGKIPVTLVKYNMEDHVKASVDRYCNMVKTLTGKDVKLKHAATPFLEEDHKNNRAGRPACTVPSKKCPWCNTDVPLGDYPIAETDQSRSLLGFGSSGLWACRRRVW